MATSIKKVFLSHFQTQGGDQVGFIWTLLKQQNISGWYDQKVEDVTGDTMKQGVIGCDLFLLMLTAGIGQSWFTALEISTAIKNQKKIVCVLETDLLRGGLLRDLTPQSKQQKHPTLYDLVRNLFQLMNNDEVLKIESVNSPQDLIHLLNMETALIFPRMRETEMIFLRDLLKPIYEVDLKIMNEKDSVDLHIVCAPNGYDAANVIRKELELEFNIRVELITSMEDVITSLQVINVLVIFCTDSIFEQEHVFQVINKVKKGKIVFVHEGDFRRPSVQIAKSKYEGNELVWLQNEINEKVTAQNHLRMKFLDLAEGSLSYGKAERKLVALKGFLQRLMNYAGLLQAPYSSAFSMLKFPAEKIESSLPKRMLTELSAWVKRPNQMGIQLFVEDNPKDVSNYLTSSSDLTIIASIDLSSFANDKDVLVALSSQLYQNLPCFHSSFPTSLKECEELFLSTAASLPLETLGNQIILQPILNTAIHFPKEVKKVILISNIQNQLDLVNFLLFLSERLPSQVGIVLISNRKMLSSSVSLATADLFSLDSSFCAQEIKEEDKEEEKFNDEKSTDLAFLKVLNDEWDVFISFVPSEGEDTARSLALDLIYHSNVTVWFEKFDNNIQFHAANVLKLCRSVIFIVTNGSTQDEEQNSLFKLIEQGKIKRFTRIIETDSLRCGGFKDTPLKNYELLMYHCGEPRKRMLDSVCTLLKIKKGEDEDDDNINENEYFDAVEEPKFLSKFSLSKERLKLNAKRKEFPTTSSAQPAAVQGVLGFFQFVAGVGSAIHSIGKTMEAVGNVINGPTATGKMIDLRNLIEDESIGDVKEMWKLPTRVNRIGKKQYQNLHIPSQTRLLICGDFEENLDSLMDVKQTFERKGICCEILTNNNTHLLIRCQGILFYATKGVPCALMTKKALLSLTYHSVPISFAYDTDKRRRISAVKKLNGDLDFDSLKEGMTNSSQDVNTFKFFMSNELIQHSPQARVPGTSQDDFVNKILTKLDMEPLRNSQEAFDPDFFVLQKAREMDPGSREWFFEIFDTWFNEREFYKKSGGFIVFSPAGFGKSVCMGEILRRYNPRIATRLSGVDPGGNRIVAYHFFSFNSLLARDGLVALLSISFQLEANIYGFKMPSIEQIQRLKIENKSDFEMWLEVLIFAPARRVEDRMKNENDGEGSRKMERVAILFDAFDECVDQNSLLHAIESTWNSQLPDGGGLVRPEWLLLIASMRPSYRLDEHSKFYCYELHPDCNENLVDLQIFLMRRMISWGVTVPPQIIVNAILKQSEGIFLYIKMLLSSLQETAARKELTLTFIEKLPKGMKHLLRTYFQQYLQAMNNDEELYRTSLSIAMLVPRDPLPEAIWRRVLGFDDETYRNNFLIPLSRILTVESPSNIIRPPHKSVIDWLSGNDPSSSAKGMGLDYLAVTVQKDHHLKLALVLEEIHQNLQEKDDENVKNYVKAHCAYHFMKGENKKKACEWFTDFERLYQMISASAQNKQYQRVLSDAFELKNESKLMEFVFSILNLSEVALMQDPRQLAGQVIGRCGARPFHGPAKHFVREAREWLKRNQFNFENIFIPVEGLSNLETVNNNLVKIIRVNGNQPIICFAISSSFTRIAVSYGNEVAVYEFTKQIWDLKWILKGHQKQITCIVFAKKDENVLLTGSKDNTARLWKDGKCLKLLEGHLQEVNSVAISDFGEQLVTGSSDNHILVYTTLENEQPVFGQYSSNRLKQNSGWFKASGVNCVLFYMEYLIAAVVYGEDIVIYNNKDLTEVCRIKGRFEAVHTIDITNDGNMTLLATNHGSKSVALWKFPTNEIVGYLTPPNVTGGTTQTVVHCCRFSPNGRLLAASTEETVRVWDVQSLSCVKEYLHWETLSCVGFLSNDLLTFSSSTLCQVFSCYEAKQFEQKNSKKLVRSTHESEITQVLVTRDDHHIITRSTYSVRIWNARNNHNGKRVSVITNDSFLGNLYSVQLSNLFAQRNLLKITDHKGISIVYHISTGLRIPFYSFIWRNDKKSMETKLFVDDEHDFTSLVSFTRDLTGNPPEYYYYHDKSTIKIAIVKKTQIEAWKLENGPITLKEKVFQIEDNNKDDMNRIEVNNSIYKRKPENPGCCGHAQFCCYSLCPSLCLSCMDKMLTSCGDCICKNSAIDRMSQGYRAKQKESERL